MVSYEARSMAGPFFSLAPFHRLLKPLYNTLSDEERKLLRDFEKHLQKGANTYDDFENGDLFKEMLKKYRVGDENPRNQLLEQRALR